jgi:eukaryotic-like serine/threonine-protein kinase
MEWTARSHSNSPRRMGRVMALVVPLVSISLVLPQPAGAARSQSRDPGRPDLLVDWATFHGTPDRVGLNTLERILNVGNVDLLNVAWSFKTGGKIWSSPAVAGGVVYIGSDDNSVYALNALTGTKIWSHGTSGDVRSSPTVWRGMVFVGSDDNKILALNTLTGDKVWNYKISGDVGRASPLVSGTTVYIGAQDGNLYALNALTGNLRWQLNTWAVWGAPAIAGNTLYVGSDKSVLYALNPSTGATKWSATLGDRVRCTPSVKNGTVYVGADDYRVYAYDASTGVLKWKTAAFPNKGIVRSSPAVWNGMVFVDTGETSPMGSHVYALDADTGATVWSHTMADYATSSPAIANGVLYTGSYDHQIYAFDATTGDKLWTSGYDEMQGGIPGSVAVVNGTVYIGSKDDSVYAFGL